MSLFNELKRRNVLRVIAAYIVTSWLIVQVVETIFPAFGFSDAIVRSTVIVLAIGLVPAAVIAWVFELTPEGLKRDRDVDRDFGASYKNAKRLDRIILVVLAVAVTYFMFDKLLLEPRREAALIKVTTEAITGQLTEAWRAEFPELSVAVLPFVNLSDEESEDYFSEGFSEDIAIALSKFRNLRIMSPQLTYPYRDATDPGAAGEALLASYLVTGSVRIGPGMVRINVRLSTVPDSVQLWANSYDEKLTVSNLFMVQGDVAGRVVATIADSTGILSMAGQRHIRSQPTQSLEAYECVLRSHEYRRVHDTKTHLMARDCLEHAVELDPNYADAWAHLAFLYREEFHHERNLRPDPLGRALAAAQRAIELDPSNHMARFALAFIQKSRGDWEAAVYQADKTLELNPYDATTLGMFSAMFVYHGDIERGIDLAERAKALVPDPPAWINIPYASAYYQQGQYEKTLEVLSHWTEGSNAPQWNLHNVVALGQLGRQEEAARALVRYLEVEPAMGEDPNTKIGKYASNTEVAGLYLDGLEKAGLQSAR